MKYDDEKYKAKYAEAQTRWPTLNKKQLNNLALVWLAVDQLTPNLKPGQKLTVDEIRLHMSDPEAGTGPSTATVGKYVRMLEEYEAQAPHPQGPAAASLDLPPDVVTAINAACNTVTGAFRAAFTTAVAEESERSRVALAASRYQNDVSRRQYTDEIEALNGHRQKIEAESEKLEEEVEELRVKATESKAACESATAKAGGLEHELAVAKLELENATQQLGEIRAAWKLEHERVEKAEAESQRHQRLLHEMTQQHAADIAEVRASCAADVERERKRNFELDLAIVGALGAVAPCTAANQEDAR